MSSCDPPPSRLRGLAKVFDYDMTVLYYQKSVDSPVHILIFGKGHGFDFTCSTIKYELKIQVPTHFDPCSIC